MKLTKSQLKQLIKEELQNALNEQTPLRKTMRAAGYDVPAVPAHAPEYHSPASETNRLLRETNGLLRQLVKLANRS